MFFRFLYPHDQVFVRANWNLSGLYTEKAESVIRVTYRQRSFYQVHVLINAVLSRFCTGRTNSVPWRQVVEFIVERFIMERFIVERFIMERFIMER